MAEALASSSSRTELENSLALHHSDAYLLTEPVQSVSDPAIHVLIHVLSESNLTHATLSVNNVRLIQGTAAIENMSPLQQSNSVPNPPDSTVPAPKSARFLSKQTSVFEAAPIPAPKPLQAPRPLAESRGARVRVPLARQISTPVTQEEASNFGRTPSLLRQEGIPDCAWVLLPQHSSIRAQSIVPGVYLASFPLPVEGPQSVWAIESGTSAKLAEAGLLSFQVTVNHPGKPQVVSQTMHAEVHSKHQCARSIFAFVCNAAQPAEFEARTLFADLTVLYTNLFAALWSIQDRREQGHDIVTPVVYQFAWQHGLLLNNLQRLAYRQSPLSANKCLAVLATFFETQLSKQRKPTQQQLLQLWVAIGAVLNLALDLSEHLEVPDQLWQACKYLPDFRELQVWYHSPTSAETWQEGREHLKHLFRAGTMLLYNHDRLNLFSTFRFTRFAPYLRVLHNRNELPEMVASSLAGLVAPKNVKETEAAVAKRLSTSLAAGNNASKNLFEQVIEYLRAFNSGSSETIESWLKSIPAAQAHILTFFGHPLHDVVPTTNQQLRAAIDAAAAALRAAEVAQYECTELSTELETARQSITLSLNQAQHLKDLMPFLSLPHTSLRMPAEYFTALPVEPSKGKLPLQDPTLASETAFSTAVNPVAAAHSTESAQLKSERSLAPSADNDDQQIIITICGVGSSKGMQDGIAAKSTLHTPVDFVEMPADSMLILERGNSALRMVDSAMNVTTLIGRQGAGCQDGTIDRCRLQQPRGLCRCLDGSVLIVDTGNHCIRVLDPALTSVKTFAGEGSKSGFADGAASKSQFKFPSAALQLPSGDVLVADQFNNRIRMISNGKVSTLVGTGDEGHVDGPASSALLHHPVGMCLLDNNRVAFADSENHVVRCLDLSSNTVTTLAGVPKQSGCIDGAAATALFSTPTHVCVDKNGTIVISDSGNNRLRALLTDGRVVTVAGHSTAGFQDGYDDIALFTTPLSVRASRQAGLIVADSGNQVRFIIMHFCFFLF
jgi:hypothetical protein